MGSSRAWDLAKSPSRSSDEPCGKPDEMGHLNGSKVPTLKVRGILVEHTARVLSG